MSSTVSRLRSDFTCLIDRMANFVQELPIRQRRHVAGVISVVQDPDYYWGKPSIEQLNTQIAIKRDYEEWIEIFRSVFAKATKDLDRKIEEADRRLRMWIELSRNWSLRPDPVSNERSLRIDAERFMKILSIAEASEPMPPVPNS